MPPRVKSFTKRGEIAVAVRTETERTLSLAHRVNLRLRRQLNDTKGIPDEGWLQGAKWVSRTIAELGRLIEGKLGTADQPGDLSDEEYQAEMRTITVEVLRKADTAERRRLIDEADGTIAAPLVDEPEHEKHLS